MIKLNFCHIISCATSPLSTLFNLVSLSCLTQKFPKYLLATKDVLVSSELSGFSEDLEILNLNIVGYAFILTFSPDQKQKKKHSHIITLYHIITAVTGKIHIHINLFSPKGYILVPYRYIK